MLFMSSWLKSFCYTCDYRCWRVRWPKKNDVDNFKDANEVRFHDMQICDSEHLGLYYPGY